MNALLRFTLIKEAKARLHRVLEAVADKYDIAANDVSYAIDGYTDDMLSDLVFGLQRDLEQAPKSRRRCALCRHDRAPNRQRERALCVPAPLCRPMSEFDPSEPALVHDRRRNRMLPWSPTFQRSYEVIARELMPGVIDYDGLQLDGWMIVDDERRH